MENLPIGYLSCRSCGSIENCADLVSGLCLYAGGRGQPTLPSSRATTRRRCKPGPAASVEIAQLIRDYQQSEGVRLKNVPEPTGSPEKGPVRIWPVGGPISASPFWGSWYIHRPPIVAPGPSCTRSGMNWETSERVIEIPAYKDELRNTWYASFYYTDWQGKRRLKKKRGFQRKKDARR